ncbi:MAG: glycosyltransferase family 39 protein, partial [Sciscionella sp.]|nr:glycosyltransferase family 39 protein [Sciscionella sp.]
MASWLVPLLVQVGLSLRLLWSNTAFLNEAQYLYAGHQELANKLRMLGYDTYFSGHPSLYPVLGALVDSIGGLTAARLLGLAFMLLATWLLYRMTTDMFGPVAGCAAALAFAAIAPTQFLSAFATYDPMAMAMLAVAAYCAHRATWTATRHDGALVLSFIALLIADFTKYAVVLYTPVVLAILL